MVILDNIARFLLERLVIIQYELDENELKIYVSMYEGQTNLVQLHFYFEIKVFGLILSALCILIIFPYSNQPLFRSSVRRMEGSTDEIQQPLNSHLGGGVQAIAASHSPRGLFPLGSKLGTFSHREKKRPSQIIALCYGRLHVSQCKCDKACIQNGRVRESRALNARIIININQHVLFSG